MKNREISEILNIGAISNMVTQDDHFFSCLGMPCGHIWTGFMLDLIFGNFLKSSGPKCNERPF